MDYDDHRGTVRNCVARGVHNCAPTTGRGKEATKKRQRKGRRGEERKRTGEKRRTAPRERVARVSAAGDLWPLSLPHFHRLVFPVHMQCVLNATRATIAITVTATIAAGDNADVSITSQCERRPISSLPTATPERRPHHLKLGDAHISSPYTHQSATTDCSRCSWPARPVRAKGGARDQEVVTPSFYARPTENTGISRFISRCVCAEN